MSEGARVFAPKTTEEDLGDLFADIFESGDAERDEPDLFEATPQAPSHAEVQPLLFELKQPWEEHWVGMPEFVQEDLAAWKTVTVHFACRADMEEFAALIEQRMTPNTRALWFPSAEIGRYANKRYVVPKEAEQ